MKLSWLRFFLLTHRVSNFLDLVIFVILAYLKTRASFDVQYDYSRRYERGHWDAVITDYKEIELVDESFPLSEDTSSINDDESGSISIPGIFRRIRNHLEHRHLQHKLNSIVGNEGRDTSETPNDDTNTVSWLPCHGIDLKVDGELNAHVDSVKFSGDLIAGLSLLSPSIMRLKPAQDDYLSDDADEYRSKVSSTSSSTASETNNEDGQGWVDLYLPPRSLYALTGVGRYRYSHELLPSGSTFLLNESHSMDDSGEHTTATEITVYRDHRLSVIFRDAK